MMDVFWWALSKPSFERVHQGCLPSHPHIFHGEFLSQTDSRAAPPSFDGPCIYALKRVDKGFHPKQATIEGAIFFFVLNDGAPSPEIVQI